jgi:hypothetical protein
MAVSSGRRKPIKEMTEAKEYFGVGDRFMYSPHMDKSTLLYLEVVEMKGIPSYKECLKCALFNWCGEEANYTTDNYGAFTNYVPRCHKSDRLDGTDVYFKEV